MIGMLAPFDTPCGIPVRHAARVWLNSPSGWPWRFCPVGAMKMGSGTGVPRKVVAVEILATGMLMRGMKRRKEKEAAVARIAEVRGRKGQKEERRKGAGDHCEGVTATDFELRGEVAWDGLTRGLTGTIIRPRAEVPPRARSLSQKFLRERFELGKVDNELRRRERRPPRLHLFLVLRRPNDLNFGKRVERPDGGDEGEDLAERVVRVQDIEQRSDVLAGVREDGVRSSRLFPSSPSANESRES